MLPCTPLGADCKDHSSLCSTLPCKLCEYSERRLTGYTLVICSKGLDRAQHSGEWLCCSCPTHMCRRQ